MSEAFLTPRAITALERAGFIQSFAFGINIFVVGPQGKAREAVRILFAGEPVKPSDPTAGPDLSQTDWQEGYPIVDFPRLIGMKLTAFRDKDRTHLRDMIDVGLITLATLADCGNSLPLLGCGDRQPRKPSAFSGVGRVDYHGHGWLFPRTARRAARRPSAPAPGTA